MKAALTGPSAHYFVFINISLAGARNRDPRQLINCCLIHLFQLGQQHKASFTFTQALNDNGLSPPQGGRSAGVRPPHPPCLTPLSSVSAPVSLPGHGSCQEDTLRRCYRPMPAPLAGRCISIRPPAITAPS